MTNLFVIGTTDFTAYEDTEQHAVNKVDIFEEWTDGNWNTHRVIARTRVEGAVVLNFSRTADYAAFLTLLSTARRTNGDYSITVYCANTDTSETVYAFLDVAGDTKFDVTAPIKHYSVTITITER